MRKRAKSDGIVSLKSSESRAEDFSDLTEIIALCWEKVNLKNTTNPQKQAWCRIMISGYDQRETMRKNADAEELEERIRIVEEALKRSEE